MKFKAIYVGIDPGKSGAVAALNQDGEIVSIQDTPTMHVKKGRKNSNVYLPSNMMALLKAINDSGKIAVVGIERAQAMPRQGSTSGFTIGYGYGLWTGIAIALQLPIEVIEAQAWKRHARIPIGSDKKASIVRALQIWPSCRELSRRKDDGRAEALMIAEYMRASAGRSTSRR